MYDSFSRWFDDRATMKHFATDGRETILERDCRDTFEESGGVGMPEVSG